MIVSVCILISSLHISFSHLFFYLYSIWAKCPCIVFTSSLLFPSLPFIHLYFLILQSLLHISTVMLRQSLLSTDFHSQSSIRIYRNRISLLLLPISVIILFIFFTSYSNEWLHHLCTSLLFVPASLVHSIHYHFFPSVLKSERWAEK